VATSNDTKEVTAPSRENDSLQALLGLLPTWIAFLWLVSKAQWFWTHKPEMEFGWMVLLLSGFVLWDQWARRPALSPRIRWPIFFLVPLGGGLLFLMQIYQAAYGMMPAVLMGLSAGVYAIAAANICYLYGWRGLRFFAFPILFFLIALPLPSFLYNPIVGGLQQKVAAVNVEVLNIIGIPAHQVGSLIQLPNGTVGVNEACSGIRSLQSTIMATLFIGYLTLRRGPLQWALLVFGIFLAIFGNLIRSLYLSLTANAKGIAMVEKVHDTAGWSILLFTALGVAVAAWLFTRFEKWMAADTKRLEQEAALTRAS
jgi:exosortase